METARPNKAIVALIVIVLLSVAAGGVVYVLSGKNDTLSQVTTDSQSSEVSAVKPSHTHAAYKDGKYSATGSYVSPGGQESITVTVTLKADTITEASVTTEPASSTSSQYQGIFTTNYKPLVVGKPINEVALDRVAGSSLTSGGFNDALEHIRDEAAQ